MYERRWLGPEACIFTCNERQVNGDGTYDVMYVFEGGRKKTTVEAALLRKR